MFKKISDKLKVFWSGDYNILLLFLILLFVFRPSNQGIFYIVFWQLIFAGVLISSIFNCRHRMITKVLTALLAVPAVLFNWMALTFESSFVIGLFLLFSFLFILVIATSIVNEVILHAKVTLSTLRGVVCAYFLLGFSFAFGYCLIEYFVPNSFTALFPEPLVLAHTHYLSELIYFSFITLLTIGYGDITVVSEIARSLAVVEGIIGQFYIAILVARIVAVYTYYSEKEVFPKAPRRKRR